MYYKRPGCLVPPSPPTPLHVQAETNNENKRGSILRCSFLDIYLYLYLSTIVYTFREHEAYLEAYLTDKRQVPVPRSARAATLLDPESKRPFGLVILTV